MSQHEYASVNEKLDWKKAKNIVAGVDVGAVSTKAMILLDGQAYAISLVTTRVPEESALKAVKAALAKTDMPMEKIQYLVGTGRGRKQVEFAHKTLSEIVCAALGAVHVWGPSVRTVLDAGGQSLRVIQCTEKGRATSFLWNDKCAAGVGRSMDAGCVCPPMNMQAFGGIAQ